MYVLNARDTQDMIILFVCYLALLLALTYLTQSSLQPEQIGITPTLTALIRSQNVALSGLELTVSSP